MDWHFVGQLADRNAWQACSRLDEQATNDRGNCKVNRWRCASSVPPGSTLPSIVRVGRAGKRAQAPGLVHTSLSASQACASKRVNRYAQRMPIEEAFRDLKSRRFGVDLEHRQSRKQER